jgi:hypothetical protein
MYKHAHTCVYNHEFSAGWMLSDICMYKHDVHINSININMNFLQDEACVCMNMYSYVCINMNILQDRCFQRERPWRHFKRQRRYMFTTKSCCGFRKTYYWSK